MAIEDEPILKIDTEAPGFSLPDQDGAQHSLSDYRGKWVFLYFYIKDDTDGCSRQACAIRDAFIEFERYGTVVLGISIDSPESHKLFSEKYQIPFPLLSDTTKRVMNIYGVWEKKQYLGKEKDGAMRVSFLIDPMGIIEKVYKNLKPEKHAAEVLEDLRRLQNDE